MRPAVTCALLAVLSAGGLPGCHGDAPRDSSPRGSGGPERAGEPLPLTFEILGAFEVPGVSDSGAPESGRGDAGPGRSDSRSRIPPEILDLDGRRVSLEGYMVPVDFEQRGASRFVLLKCTLACCYGKMPLVNEWIDVTMSGGERVPYRPDQPVWVIGILRVEEEIEDGSLVGLYRIEAERVIES